MTKTAVNQTSCRRRISISIITMTLQLIYLSLILHESFFSSIHWIRVLYNLIISRKQTRNTNDPRLGAFQLTAYIACWHRVTGASREATRMGRRGFFQDGVKVRVRNRGTSGCGRRLRKHFTFAAAADWHTLARQCPQSILNTHIDYGIIGNVYLVNYRMETSRHLCQSPRRFDCMARELLISSLSR